MTANLSNHLEIMNHEMERVDFEITHQGYRVDGENSIKKVVQLDNRKSIDYFYIKNAKCLFVEFSDLAWNKEDLLGVNESINNIDNTFHQNKLRKLIKNDHRDEMISKFKDSKDIFAKIPTYFQNIPPAFLNNDAKIFYIVHAPILETLPETNKAEIARYLIDLSARISACLEDEICERVKLIFVEQFIAELE